MTGPPMPTNFVGFDQIPTFWGQRFAPEGKWNLWDRK
jgi:hypothetical protein